MGSGGLPRTLARSCCRLRRGSDLASWRGMTASAACPNRSPLSKGTLDERARSLRRRVDALGLEGCHPALAAPASGRRDDRSWVYDAVLRWCVRGGVADVGG